MSKGKAREMGFGPVALIPLAEARVRAIEARRLLLEWIDPIKHRQAEREAKIVRGKVSPIAQRRIARRIRRGGAMPSMRGSGGRPCRPTLFRFWGRRRLRGRIEAVVDYATTKGWQQGDNPAWWRGLLENVLPAKGRITRVTHHAALPWRDLPGFMVELMTQDGMATQALVGTLLTAVRMGDALGATWKVIDFGAQIWTIPDWRVKGRKAEHRVPLADPVMAILTSVRSNLGSLSPSAFVFPGGREGLALSNMAMLALLRRMERDDCNMDNAAPAAKTTPRRETLNLRIKPEDRGLIDRAAALTGKSKTDFFLEAARRAAEEALLDRSLFITTPDAFEAFRARLDELPGPNARLERSLQTNPPWK